MVSATASAPVEPTGPAALRGPSQGRQRQRWRPAIRSIVLALNLITLLLPLGGIVALRIFESELVRQTESELLAQGAVLAAAYAQALGPVPAGYGRPLPREPYPEGSFWRPQPTRLDLAADPVLPPPPPAEPASRPADAPALAAGAALDPVLKEAQRTTLSAIRLLSPDGIVVATTRGEQGYDLSGQEEVRRAMRGEWVRLLRERPPLSAPVGLETFSRGAALRVFVAVPVRGEGDRLLGIVHLSRTPRELLRALYDLRETLLKGFAVVLAIMAALAALTVRAVARPLQAVAGQARRAAAGERHAIQPLEHPVTAEVADLSAAVVALTETLSAREAAIRDFARQISHELKTPIANIRGAAELLAEDGARMTAEDRDRFIANIQRQAAKMQRLVQRLLVLARAEAGVPVAGRVALEEVPGLLERLAVEAGVALSLDHSLPQQGGALDLPMESLDSILGALLENARQHGRGDRTRVSVGGQVLAGRQLSLWLSDDGPGIAEGLRERIFEPFVTSRAAEGATGLGLAIVAALLRAHRGTIRLLPAAPGQGAGFQLTLPLAAEADPGARESDAVVT